MISGIQKQKLRDLLSETLFLLCQSSLPSNTPFSLDAIIGVTLGSDEVVLVSVKKETALQKENHHQQQHESILSDSNDALQVNDANEGEGPTTNGLTCVTKQTIGHSTSSINEEDQQHSINVDNYDSHDMSENEMDLAHKSNDDTILIKSEVITSDDEYFDEMSPYKSQPGQIPDNGKKLFKKARNKLGLYQDPQLQLLPMLNFNFNRYLGLDGDCKNLSLNQAVGGENIDLPQQSHFDFTPGQRRPRWQSQSMQLTRRLVNSYSCHICGATLKGKQSLNDHIRGTHFSLCSFPCKHCGKSFKWRSGLRTHKAVCPGRILSYTAVNNVSNPAVSTTTPLNSQAPMLHCTTTGISEDDSLAGSVRLKTEPRA